MKSPKTSEVRIAPGNEWRPAARTRRRLFPSQIGVRRRCGGEIGNSVAVQVGGGVEAHVINGSGIRKWRPAKACHRRYPKISISPCVPAAGTYDGDILFSVAVEIGHSERDGPPLAIWKNNGMPAIAVPGAFQDREELALVSRVKAMSGMPSPFKGLPPPWLAVFRNTSIRALEINACSARRPGRNGQRWAGVTPRQRGISVANDDVYPSVAIEIGSVNDPARRSKQRNRAATGIHLGRRQREWCHRWLHSGNPSWLTSPMNVWLSPERRLRSRAARGKNTGVWNVPSPFPVATNTQLSPSISRTGSDDQVDLAIAIEAIGRGNRNRRMNPR